MQKSSSTAIRPTKIVGYLCALLLLLYGTTALYGQNINFAAGCPNPDETLPEVIVNTEMPDRNITAIGGDGDVTMSILDIHLFASGIDFPDVTCPCPPGSTIAGLTFEMVNGGTTVRISGTPAAANAGQTIVFTLRASTANDGNCDKTFRLPIVAPPLDLALILDRSGSMAWQFDGSFSGPGPSRWQGLLTAIDASVAHFQGLNGFKTGDRLALRFFASAPPSHVITPATPPYNAPNLIDATLDNVNGLTAAINTATPFGGTALGDGILAGRDLVLPGTPGSRKAMLVFSDGEQNAGDQVQVAGPNAFTHTQSNQKLSGNANEIQISTINLGFSGMSPYFMDNIASSNDGLFTNTLPGSPEFATQFSAVMNHIFSVGSPQFIDIRRGAFGMSSGLSVANFPSSIDTFVVNKGLDALVFTLISPSGGRPQFTALVRNGQNLIQYATQRSGPGYISAAFSSVGDTLSVDGEWIVQAQLGVPSVGAAPYTIMAGVDDHVIDLAYSTGGKNLKVGQSISPKVSFSIVGNPVTDADAHVFIGKPGVDINHTVAEAKVEFNLPEIDPGTPDVQKLAILMQDSAFREKIKANVQLLQLTYDASDSTYSGTFNDLDVTGVYQLLYYVTVDDAMLGKIHRYHEESFYVRFADIDLANSQVVYTINNAGNTVITFTPQASNGLLIGSGWGSTISLNAPDVNIVDITDRGDGSYEIVLDGRLEEGQGTLTIGDEIVFGGDTDCYGASSNIIQRIKCWLISIGLPAWSIWILLVLAVLILWLIFRKKK